MHDVVVVHFGRALSEVNEDRQLHDARDAGCRKSWPCCMMAAEGGRCLDVHLGRFQSLAILAPASALGCTVRMT